MVCSDEVSELSNATASPMLVLRRIGLPRNGSLAGYGQPFLDEGIVHGSQCVCLLRIICYCLPWDGGWIALAKISKALKSKVFGLLMFCLKTTNGPWFWTWLVYESGFEGNRPYKCSRRCWTRDVYRQAVWMWVLSWLICAHAYHM